MTFFKPRKEDYVGKEECAVQGGVCIHGHTRCVHTWAHMHACAGTVLAGARVAGYRSIWLIETGKNIRQATELPERLMIQALI